MRKVYVDVEVRWKRDGIYVPIALWWEKGQDEWERYEIDEVISGPLSRLTKTGGVARRYEIRIGHSRRCLYLEKDKWFLEVNR